MSTTFYITDKLFTDLDTTNITNEGDVENATSYGTFNDLETMELLTSADLPSQFTSSQDKYTLDEYISLLWQQARDGLGYPYNTRYDFLVARVKSGDTTFTQYGGYDRLKQYKALVDDNDAAELQTLITNHHGVSKDIEGSAEALLARAGIDTQEEAAQLVHNIISEYKANNLTLQDGQPHIFKVAQTIDPTDLYEYKGTYKEDFNTRRFEKYREDHSTLTFEIELDYDEILHAALKMALYDPIDDNQNLSDSLFAFLYQNYSDLTDNTQIREAYDPQKLYRNLIPDAFINNDALEEATADAMAMTGLDLYQMEYNYNQRHPNDKLYLTPKLWNGEGRAYRAILAAAEEWQEIYKEYPGTIHLDNHERWDEFTAWVRAVDPDKKYFKSDIYYPELRGDRFYIVYPTAYPAIQQQFEKFKAATRDTIEAVEEHILMKDRFMQSHREYLNIKERQYKATAKELSSMNKMIDAAREWHEWIGVFERKNNKSANLQQADAEKYQEFIKWITSSDVASPSANDYRPYIDWANDYDNGDTILNDEELTTLYTDIGDYLKSLENRTSLVTVDANEFLTRFNEGLEFLSMVLKRIQTTLENVLRNL
ncbi:hypothetical protein SG34_032850 [Thalassomonas viridans]|uniref:Uncharacterized protein n=1 Tax=Thalassomonas viridans TaxID=137584 RepID=A0AAF0CED7_9GAMM|nr:hypothetical protein [Thalassomonas viridans]WDE08699.1 hypothetical protein SG34_032850 [Thalassomonas viridans]